MLAGPDWARWAFALLFTGIGVWSAVHLHRSYTGPDPGPGRRAATTDHLVMSAGMATMFLPVATPVPPGLWATVFAALTGSVLWRLVRTWGTGSLGAHSVFSAHLVVHLVAAATMTLSFAALPPDGMSGSSMSHGAQPGVASAVLGTVSWFAAAYFLVHVLWCGVQLAAPSAGGRSEVDPDATAVPARHHRLLVLLTMSLGMSYMLVTMM